jgi:hypothetical protein
MWVISALTTPGQWTARAMGTLGAKDYDRESQIPVHIRICWNSRIFDG